MGLTHKYKEGIQLKKIICLLVILSVTVTMLVGCGGGRADEEPLDLTGQTLIFRSWVAEQGIRDESNFAHCYMPYLEAIEEFEQETGAKVEFVSGKDKNAMMTALSAGEPWDVLFDYNFYIDYASVGLLEPLDGYFDFSDPMFTPKYFEGRNFEGKIYSINTLNAMELGALNYNETLLKEKGLKTPDELIAENNWTWDTFLDLAQKVTEDTNGDGETDRWMLSDFNLQGFLLASNGADLIGFDDSGNLKIDIDNKNVMNALQFANDLYNKYKVIAPAGSRGTQLLDRTVAAIIDVQRFDPNVNTVAATDGDVIKSVPLPVGPDANGQYRTWLNDISFGIPAGCKNPEASAYLIKKCIHKMNEATSKYQWNEQDRNTRDILEKNATFVTTTIPGVSLTYGFEAVKKSPASTALAEWKDKLAPEIEKFNKQYGSGK